MNTKYSDKYNNKLYILLGNLQNYDPITKGKSRKRKKWLKISIPGRFLLCLVVGVPVRRTAVSGPGRAEQDNKAQIYRSRQVMP